MPVNLEGVKRIVCHFSCGAASAVATKIAISKFRDCGVPIVIRRVYLAREHEDNERFLKDCEKWFDMPIVTESDPVYGGDAHKVWQKVRFILSPSGAACTRLLKREPGERFRREGDLDVFGFTSEEQERLDLFIDNNPTTSPWAPLIDNAYSKDDCLDVLRAEGIEIPMMYRLGYRNNNCIGCPKGGAGYWNKIRVDFPKAFDDMSWYEDMLGVKLCQVQENGVRRRVSLSELPPDAGRHEPMEDMSCSFVCTWPSAQADL
jgi:3'-phosphoadenosine 5'-phosphosulfate sulfotransferase (PAPS reductase)/FAD synthetase